MITPSVEVIAAYPHLFTWVLGLLLLFSFSALVYYIRMSDLNNSAQWRHLDDHGQRISHIEGRCEGTHYKFKKDD